VFVRRWGRRIVIGAGLPALAIVLASPLVGPALALPVASGALLGLALFLSAPLTFTGGLLQGLAYFGWFGWYFIAQALVRLVGGVALVGRGVVLGRGVCGAG